MRASNRSYYHLSPYLRIWRATASPGSPRPAHAALRCDGMRSNAIQFPTSCISLPIERPGRESISARRRCDWALRCAKLWRRVGALHPPPRFVASLKSCHTHVPPCLTPSFFAWNCPSKHVCKFFLPLFFNQKRSIFCFLSLFISLSLLRQANHYSSCQCYTYRIHSNI